jgi:hypothetical protein
LKVVKTNSRAQTDDKFIKKENLKMLHIFFAVFVSLCSLSLIFAQPKMPKRIPKVDSKQIVKTQTKQLLPTDFEKEVLAEINKLRVNPSVYTKILEEYLTKFNGKNVKIADKIEIITEEGKTPVVETIELLKLT